MDAIRAETSALKAAIHEVLIAQNANAAPALYALLETVQAMTHVNGHHAWTLKVLFQVCANIVSDAEGAGSGGEPDPPQ